MPPVLGALKTRRQDIAFEHAPHGLVDGESLLPHGGDVPPYPAEPFGSFETAETPGDFRPDLDRPDIPLGEIVVEGNLEVVEELEIGLFVISETHKEIMPFGFFELPPLPGFSYRFFMLRQSFLDNSGVFLVNFLERTLAQAVFSFRDCLVFEPFGPEEKRFHFFRPEYFFILYDPDELSQVVGVAEDVHALPEREVGLPMVVDQFSRESFEYAHGPQRFPSPFRMDLVRRQELRAGDVYPVEILADVRARLVVVEHRAPLQRPLDAVGDGTEVSVSLLVELHEARLAYAEPEDLVPEFLHPLEAQHPVVVEVTGMRLDIRAVLDRRGDPVREYRCGDRPAAGAFLFPSPVFVDEVGWFRDIQDLPFLNAGHRDSFEALSASGTRHHVERFKTVGGFDRKKRRTFVSLLSSSLLVALFPKGAILVRILVPVRGRRLAGVAAVHAEPSFEFGDLGYQEPDFFRLLRNQNEKVLFRGRSGGFRGGIRYFRGWCFWHEIPY